MTDQPKNLIYWCGVPIDTMTREELIEALEGCATHAAQMHEQNMREWRILDQFRRARSQP